MVFIIRAVNMRPTRLSLGASKAKSKHVRLIGNPVCLRVWDCATTLGSYGFSETLTTVRRIRDYCGQFDDELD